MLSKNEPRGKRGSFAVEASLPQGATEMGKLRLSFSANSAAFFAYSAVKAFDLSRTQIKVLTAEDAKNCRKGRKECFPEAS